MVSIIGQVFHLGTVHLLLPGALGDANVISARTKRSLKFFGRRKTMIGGNGMAFPSRSKA